MNSSARLVAVVAGLVFILNITPSWGGPPNPTMSDGNFNTAGGTAALQIVVPGMSGGFGNTAFGQAALFSNTTGTDNTASGAFALQNNTTGNFNTASGLSALFSNTTGVKNTAVGVLALAQSTGKKNIAIGYHAGATLTLGNSNIYLGHPGNGSESHTVRLGSSQTRTFIAGIATAGVNGATVEIDTMTGQLGITPSSARYKRDIAAMGTRSEGVLQLRPVTFAYRDDTQGVMHYGLIAEEVAAVYPELVTHTATGEVQGVRYQELIPMLLNELQRQRQELQHQQQKLADLRALLGQRRGAEAVIPSPIVAVGETGSLPQ